MTPHDSCHGSSVTPSWLSLLLVKGHFSARPPHALRFVFCPPPSSSNPRLVRRQGPVPNRARLFSKALPRVRPPTPYHCYYCYRCELFLTYQRVVLCRLLRRYQRLTKHMRDPPGGRGLNIIGARSGRDPEGLAPGQA